MTNFASRFRRDAGAVERATLERWYTRKGIEGSNPSLSDKMKPPFWEAFFFGLKEEMRTLESLKEPREIIALVLIDESR